MAIADATREDARKMLQTLGLKLEARNRPVEVLSGYFA
jgi:hypothetical protein